MDEVPELRRLRNFAGVSLLSLAMWAGLWGCC